MSPRKQLRAALAVPRLGEDLNTNLAEVERLTREAAARDAELVVFPETTLSGFVHVGEPDRDRRLAVAVPGPETDRLSALARSTSIYLAVGLLEHAGAELYDSVLLFGPDGRIMLKYRRVSPGWHRPDADPAVYRQGTNLPVAHTPLGTVAFLICGDITEDVLLDTVRRLKVDLLLFPIARGFDDDFHDEREWEEQEVGILGERVAMAGVPTLMVNYVGDMDGFCGGAVAFRADGSVLDSLPLNRPGLLLVDLPISEGEQDRGTLRPPEDWNTMQRQKPNSS